MRLLLGTAPVALATRLGCASRPSIHGPRDIILRRDSGGGNHRCIEVTTYIEAYPVLVFAFHKYDIKFIMPGRAIRKREPLTKNEKYSSALLSMHAFTGCDTVSAFKGRGKLKALKALQQHPHFIERLAKLGESWHMDTFLLDDVEAFTCTMYGRANFTNVDDLRYYMLKEKCRNETVSSSTNIDLSALPPCRKSLKQHA